MRLRRSEAAFRRADAVIRGVVPKAGMWLVHHGNRRVYGPIVVVRATGAVVWHCALGRNVEADPRRLYDGGYSYAETKPDGYEHVHADARGAA